MTLELDWTQRGHVSDAIADTVATRASAIIAALLHGSVDPSSTLFVAVPVELQYNDCPLISDTDPKSSLLSTVMLWRLHRYYVSIFPACSTASLDLKRRATYNRRIVHWLRMIFRSA